MKIIVGVFLLFISSSLADDCEDFYGDGHAKCRSGICNHEEVPKLLPAGLCPGETCCVEECEARYDGECTDDPDCGNKVEVAAGLGACQAGWICCIRQTDTLCDEHMDIDGLCKTNCDNDEEEVGDPYTALVNSNGCLCPSSLLPQCCVEKGDDACDDIKHGDCVADQAECAAENGIVTSTAYCVAGEVCCIKDEQPCEKPVANGGAGGICAHDHDSCPEGYSTAEELCIPKPDGVYEWCYDSGDICCVQ